MWAQKISLGYKPTGRPFGGRRNVGKEKAMVIHGDVYANRSHVFPNRRHIQTFGYERVKEMAAVALEFKLWE